MNADWIRHILRRNRLLEHVTAGKMEGYKRRENEKQD